MIDLLENQSISLSWRFSDIQELAILGSYTKQFRIPASDRNVALFGPLFNVNLVSGNFSYHKKCTAVLAVDTIPITQGHVQMLRTYTTAGQVNEFELVFYAETPDLSRALGSLKLADLDYTGMDHDITYDNVVDGDYLDNWQYALTDRGQKWSQLGEVGSRPINNLANPIYANEMTPCVKALWIMDKIMSTAGFNWLGSTLENELDNFWLPYVNARTVQTGIPEQAYLFNLGYTADQSAFTPDAGGTTLTGLNEFYDNNGDVASSVWTAPYTGVFRFKMWATIDPTGSPSNETFFFKLRRTDNNTTAWQSVSYNIQNGNILNIQTPVIEIFLAAGQTFVMQLAASSGLNIVLKGDTDNNPAVGTGWALVGTDGPVADETMSFAANAPDMLQIDFVKSIVKATNCVVIPDRNIPKKLSFIPFTEYLESGETKDWTAKIDLSKDVVKGPTTELQKRNLTFTYKAGSDVASGVYTKLGRIFGDNVYNGYTVNDTDTANEFAQGELKVELGFASTPLVEINGTNIPICKFVGETGDFQTPGPRLLYLTEKVDVALYDEGTLAGAAAQVNTLSHYSLLHPNAQVHDLNFWNEVPLYYIAGNPYNNLFNKWHRGFLNEIYSPQARILDAYFSLSITDILGFKFNDQIFIVDSYWRILEIDNYVVGTQDTTKVRLIKVLSSTIDCASTPSGTTVGGQVEWVDFAGDPTTGTEACCIRYGYAWNSVGNYCSSFGGDGVDRRRTLAGFNGGQLNQLVSSLVLASGSVISPESVQSLITGSGHNISEGNPFSLIVGDTLQASSGLRALALLGKNVSAVAPGLHLGGGWFDNDRNGPDGRAQSGVIIYQGEGDWAATTDQISLLIEGISGNHLTLPDETMWNAELSVSIVRLSGGNIVARGNAQFIIDISKYGGIARAGTVTTVFQSGSMGTFNVVMDTATNTAQSRLALSSTGGGAYPYNDIKITATLTYSQVKTT